MDIPPSDSPDYRCAAYQSVVEIDVAQSTPPISAPATSSGDAAAPRGDTVLRPPALTEFDKKYPPDEFGEELADNARVWTVYKDHATAFDGTMLDTWNKTLDILLIFAGLFSAVVTTFAAVSAQALQPDYTQMSFYVLLAMASANNTAVPDTILASLRTPPAVPLAGRVVNVLWFVSLLLSLSTALLSILAKQWLSEYTINGTAIASAQHWARLRQFRFTGLSDWHVPTIIGMLPALLHWSLFLFFTGVVVQMWSLDFTTAGLTFLILVLMVGFYCVSMALPWWHPQCPYHNPLLNQTIKLVRIVGFQARKFSSQATSAVLWACAQVEHLFRALNLDFRLSPVPDISVLMHNHRWQVPLPVHHAPLLADHEADLVTALTAKLDANLLLWMLDSSPQFSVRETVVYGLAAVPAFSALANHLTQLGVQCRLEPHTNIPNQTPFQSVQYMRAQLIHGNLDFSKPWVFNKWWWWDADFKSHLPGISTLTDLVNEFGSAPRILMDSPAKMMSFLSNHALEIIWGQYRKGYVPQHSMAVTAEHVVLSASILWFRMQQPLSFSEVQRFVEMCLADFSFACDDQECLQLTPAMLAQHLQVRNDGLRYDIYMMFATEIWVQVGIDSDQWNLDESTLAALFEIIGGLAKWRYLQGKPRILQLFLSGHQRDLWKWSPWTFHRIVRAIQSIALPPVEIFCIVTELMNAPWCGDLDKVSGVRSATSSIYMFVAGHTQLPQSGLSSPQVPFSDMLLGLAGCESPLPLMFSQKLRIPWADHLVQFLWSLLQGQPSNSTPFHRMQALLEFGVVDIITRTLAATNPDMENQTKLLCALRLFYDFVPADVRWVRIDSMIMQAVHGLLDVTVESLAPSE